MSAGKVGVLAVMRHLSDLALNSGGRRGEDEDDNEPAIKLWEHSEEARAAVAELIEAANRVLDVGLDTDTTQTRNEWAAAMDSRADLRAALARVQP